MIDNAIDNRGLKVNKNSRVQYGICSVKFLHKESCLIIFIAAFLITMKTSGKKISSQQNGNEIAVVAGVVGQQVKPPIVTLAFCI